MRTLYIATKLNMEELGTSTLLFMILWLVQSAFSQSSTLSVTPQVLPQFGNCNDFIIPRHESIVLALQFYTDGEPGPGFTDINVYLYRIHCFSAGTRIGDYSTAAVYTEFTCSGSACSNVGASIGVLQRYIFFFKCRLNSTWGVYNEPGESGPRVDRSLYMPIRNPEQPVLRLFAYACSICYNVRGYEGTEFQFTGMANHHFHCQECYSQCREGLGESHCVPAIQDTLTSCCKWYVNETCLFECPHPAYTGNRTSLTCQKRINLNQRAKSNVKHLCAGHFITYYCSVFHYPRYIDITWTVTYPGEEPIILNFREGSAAVLERYNVRLRAERIGVTGRNFIESSLQFIMQRNVTFGYVGIKCGYTGLSLEDAETVDVVNISHYIPLAPTNLRVTQEVRTETETIEIVFEWDSFFVPHELYQHDTVDFSIVPIALSQQSEVTSPFTVMLSSNTFYEAKLTLSNCAGSNSTILRLFTTPLPIVTVTDQVTGQQSTTFLNLVVFYGGVGPHLTCTVESTPPVNLTWEGVESFPNGAVLNDNTLSWNRRMEFLDSGQYLCNATNLRGYTTVTVNLEVRNVPTITYINPNFPSIQRSGSSSYYVFAGQRGLIATCIAIGSPIPRVEWRRNGQVLSNGISISKGQQSIYSLAMLVFVNPFTTDDKGEYSCFARSPNGTAFQSKDISLDVSKTAKYPYDVKCFESITSSEIFFRIRLLDTRCLVWDSLLKSEIAMNFLNVLRSAASIECQGNCDGGGIEIVSTPRCSENVNTTALILGSITSNSTSETGRIFCALNNWYQKQPLVQLNRDSYHNLDTNCSLLIPSLSKSACEVKVEQVFPTLLGLPTPAVQFIAVCAGWGLLFFLCTTLSITFTIRSYKSYQGKIEMSRDTQRDLRTRVQSSHAPVYSNRLAERSDRIYQDTMYNVYSDSNIPGMPPSSRIADSEQYTTMCSDDIQTSRQKTQNWIEGIAASAAKKKPTDDDSDDDDSEDDSGTEYTLDDSEASDGDVRGTTKKTKKPDSDKAAKMTVGKPKKDDSKSKKHDSDTDSDSIGTEYTLDDSEASDGDVRGTTKKAKKPDGDKAVKMTVGKPKKDDSKPKKDDSKSMKHDSDTSDSQSDSDEFESESGSGTSDSTDSSEESEDD